MDSIVSLVSAETILEKISEITCQIQQGRELRDLVQSAICDTRMLLHSDRVLIYRFLPDGDVIVAFESVDKEGISSCRQPIRDPCINLTWIERYRQGQNTCLDDIYDGTIDPEDVALLEQLQVQAHLVMPIFCQDDLWGLLVVHDCHNPRQWQPLEVQLLHHIALQLGIAVQIRDRKQLEKSLWLANVSLEQMGIAAIWVDRHARICRVNAKFCQSLGYSREELQTLSLDRIDLTVQKIGWAEIWRSLEQQKLLTLVSQYRTQHGDYIPVEVTIQYIEFAGEEYGFAVAQDIRERLQNETQLRLQSTALDACADAIIITDNKGSIEWANPAFMQITGYSLEEAIGKNPRDFLKSGHHNSSFYQQLWRTILSGKTWRGEIINRRKDGSLYVESATITPVQNQRGEIHHFVAIKQDISERKRIEVAMQQQTERERMIQAMTNRIRQSLDLSEILHTTVTEVCNFLDTDRVLIYQFNSDKSGVVIAEAVANGWQSILGMQMTDIYFQETQAQTYLQGDIRAIDDINTADLSPWHLQLLEQLQVRAKLVVTIWQGETLWGLMVAHQCRSSRHWQPLEGELLMQLATQLAIAIQQSELYNSLEAINRELEQLAALDGLTQIANRRSFNLCLQKEWDLMRREQLPLSLLLLDVDYFKLYNDNYGHQAGDRCLCQIAIAIRQSVKRPADLVARYGGEEFAILLPQTTSEGAIHIAQNMLAAIENLAIEHAYSTVSHYITVSMGIATLIPSQKNSREALVSLADEALYQAKKQGRNTYHVYNSSNS